MNDFVNPKKRGIQLPKGAKDLVDVLQSSHRTPLNQGKGDPLDKGKCDYCGAPAVSISICYAIPGVLDEEVHRCCEQCQQDLSEFAARPENNMPDYSDLDDGTAVDQMSQQLAKQKEFILQRVRERRPQ